MNFSTILVIPLKPYRNYILSGDMFAISKQFFEELKFYDDGMRVWGGEQFELRKVFILSPITHWEKKLGLPNLVNDQVKTPNKFQSLDVRRRTFENSVF